eukprot:TRINITY_DN86641_c0_g1_i1.p1 TRINITY_DN86641_c0_g1~~TRINITY_DN86641_c0_g1_i1.p1  ORF type:complete len:421 (+),score=93.80 TRINITY_DN86641_c0_g1_i1:40-1263(+)
MAVSSRVLQRSQRFVHSHSLLSCGSRNRAALCGSRTALAVVATLAAAGRVRNSSTSRCLLHFASAAPAFSLRGRHNPFTFTLAGRRRYLHHDSKAQENLFEKKIGKVALGAIPAVAVLPDGGGLPGLLASTVSGLGSLASMFAKGYGALLLLVFLLQRKLLFLPQPNIADPAVTGGEIVLLQTDKAGPLNGARQAAVYFPPKDAEAPVFAFFHGNGDQIGWTSAYLGQQMQSAFGAGFVGIEYPGYGLAEGKPSEESIYEASEQMLRHFAKERGLDSGRVVLLGHSVGAGVAMEMAARGLGSKLILLSPFLSVAEMACEIYPFLAPVLRIAPFFVRDQFDNSAKADSLKMPVLVIHGKQDEIVPFSQGKTLSGKVKGAQLFAVEGVGHNDVFEYDVILREIARFSRA